MYIYINSYIQRKDRAYLRDHHFLLICTIWRFENPEKDCIEKHADFLLQVHLEVHYKGDKDLKRRVEDSW